MFTRTAHSLPEALYSADSVRAMDRYLIDQQGVDGFELMQSAARSAFRQLIKHWPAPDSVLIFCGAGNNGGDGYLVAANARRHGLLVECIAVAPTGKLQGDALKALNKARADGVPIAELNELNEADISRQLSSAGLVVDAMLGTGVTGAPREPVAGIIRQINRSALPVLAVDMPSGLDATTGSAEGEVVHAQLTVTFIGSKAGLYTGAGAGVCGKVVFDALDTGHDVTESGEQPISALHSWQDCRHWLPVRPMNAHKGRFGHVLVVAGDRGFGGAGIMAAEAASRTGAGLVSLVTRPEHVTAALARCPFLMVHGVVHGSGLKSLLAKADVLVCGPGMGQSAWGQQMLQQVLASGKPRVLDADALNLMAAREPVAADNHILTPHPGEAARLLGCKVHEIEADRLSAGRRIQKIWGGVVLLKGAGTVVVGDHGQSSIIAGGNPGMATGGMGDVLSGMIGALMGQMADPERVTVMAAALHLAAADYAAQQVGYMGLTPADVIDAVPRVLRKTERVDRNHDREQL
ncbi:NAD(P)H-hydrate dehydratase [Marinobacter halophilus]|uniref:Bifunctional NAD(P)H-hydrate repair enzyme n=1 Tax=Marinobacter halophilus TaxID=1323740 RepID=A0A2T1KED6_9GAMM|nr:NAD(P)H-hydrate dehydratase [Marinobacter halophilus]PSF07902.1 bifunctional ADP-dependent NAD(P)H-hydrate dehydratase/NAD(P)H-hydrate epimerase [Marinobacter halophilus]GGC58091.1 bifunctional NAD(P)H-hydrate repair enzyme [Marinobacter halophilus]